VQLRAVLERERRELHVGRQVRRDAEAAEQREGDLQVPRPRQEDLHVGTPEPALDVPEGDLDAHRRLVDAPIRREADEPEEGGVPIPTSFVPLSAAAHQTPAVRTEGIMMP
jgi:hypothetical protein